MRSRLLPESEPQAAEQDSLGCRRCRTGTGTASPAHALQLLNFVHAVLAALLQTCPELSCTKVAQLLAICCQEKPRKAMQACFLTNAPLKLATLQQYFDVNLEKAGFAAEVQVRHQWWHHQNPQQPPGHLAQRHEHADFCTLVLGPSAKPYTGVALTPTTRMRIKIRKAARLRT